MFSLRNNEKGFTLIELIVVMIIIGILVLLATPRFLNYIKDARVTALQVDAKVLRDGAMLYSIDESNQGQDLHEYPVLTDKEVNEIDDSDVKLEIEGLAKGDLGKAIESTMVEELGVKKSDAHADKLGLTRLSPKELRSHIRNTKNPITDYAIVTEGPLVGEVFHVGRIHENGKGMIYVHMLPSGIENK